MLSLKKFRAGAFALLLPALSGIGTSDAQADQQWLKVKESEGITVYQREVPNWSIKEIRATGSVAAPIQQVMEIVNNIQLAGRLNDIVSSAGLIRQVTPELAYYYIVLDMPWPTTDRSAIYARSISADAEHQRITITDRADVELATPAALEKTVRMLRSTQVWTLQSLDDNRTQVTLTSLTDPNGPIPAFIINTMSVDAPLQSIANLRQLAEEPEKN